MAQRTDIKDPEEVDIPFTADFTDRLAAIGANETITSVLSVTVSVVYGSDGNPSAFLSGSPSITGNKKVVQLMTGGIDGTDYKIKVKVLTSSSKRPIIAGIVPVRSK